MSSSDSSTAQLDTLGVIMIFVVVATSFGVCLFISPPPDTHPAGALPWAAGSVLKIVTDVMAFDYKIPTPNGFEVKDLVFGVAAGVAVIAVSIGLFAQRHSKEQQFSIVEAVPAPTAAPLKRQVDSLYGAQFLLILFVGWSFLSSTWSPMPELATGGTLSLLSFVLWVFALRFGLRLSATRPALTGLIIVLSLSSVIGVWYFNERNPTLRMGYPIGNPLFYAACMIPAVLLCVSWILEALIMAGRPTRRRLERVLLCILCLVPVAWGIYLADSRGTYLGLAAGVGSLVFFAVRGSKRKLMVVLGGIALATAGTLWWLLPQIAARPETVRTRLYAWKYGYQLFTESPLVGHGQGSYTLLADARAVQDVANDPIALSDWIDHAHNEWLEVLVDLGSFGAVFIIGCYALTLVAGVRALSRISQPHLRWLLIGLLAAMVAILVEECVDVALRVAGLPMVFATVLGCIWAICAGTPSAPVPAPTATRMWSLALVVGVCALGLGQLSLSVRDFHAARALYTYRQALNKRLYAQALDEVESAVSGRLSPARRLTAMLHRAWCHLKVAEGYYEEFMQRMQRRKESQAGAQVTPGPPDQQYAQRALDEAQTAIECANQLTAPAGIFMGAHEVAGGALRLAAQRSYQRGDHKIAADTIRIAAEAYRRELSRRPFSQSLVFNVLSLDPDMPLADAIDLICQPLRYYQVDRELFQLVRALSTRPNFEVEFEPIRAEALAALIEQENGGAAIVPFASEKLRIAAWLAAWKGDYSEARSYARSAWTLAIREKERFPYAPATAGKELAYYTFLADPFDPQAAIEQSFQALEYLSHSHDAEAIRERINDRLRMYYLAAGNENAARELVPSDASDERAVIAVIARDYSALCQLVWTLPQEQRPQAFGQWLQRLQNLADTQSLGPAFQQLAALMLAQYLYESGELTASLTYLHEALELGADVEQIRKQLQRIQHEHPDNAAVADMLLKLEQPTTPAPTTP